MSKIICEICGTKYPDTASECPICGYTNAAAVKTETEDDILEEVVRESRPKTKGGRFSKSNVRKHVEEEVEETPDFDEDFEEEDFEEDDDFEEEDEEDEEEEEGKSGVVLNILLGIVIVALLCVSGFIFVRYFLPNMKGEEPTVPTTEPYVETTAPETEEPTVPCTSLALTETAVELNEIGQLYLLNVDVQPLDTTDVLTFASDNEAVVTVNEEGRITAVAEGEAVVTISCGDQTLEVPVTVVVVTEAPTEEPTEEPTEAPTEPGVTKTVVSDWVKIRSGPGTEHAEVGKYEEGDVVVIYEEATCSKGRPWGRTDKGWICTEYVE